MDFDPVQDAVGSSSEKRMQVRPCGISASTAWLNSRPASVSRSSH